jgi:hypothetical protein
MTQAAEYLLKEIKSDATLKSLIGVVCSEDNFLDGINNIICNYDMYNILHQYALSNKEVSEIVVSRTQRRIKLTYALKNDLWYEFDLRNRGRVRSLFIPKKPFIMEGLEEEIGIKTFGAIYIRSDSDIYDYIIKMIGIFLKEDTEENRILLEIFLGIIFDSSILEQIFSSDVNANNMVRHVMEDITVRLSDELKAKMWLKINTDEFSKIILTQNYSLYSIDNWSRKEDGI